MNQDYIPVIPLGDEYIIAYPATEEPLPHGETSPGVVEKWAKEDHVHPGIGWNDAVVEYLNNVLPPRTEKIIEAIKKEKGEIDYNLKLDAVMASGLAPTINTNAVGYYQVKAKQIDGEMQVTVCDRTGGVLATSLSPYNTTAVILSLSFISIYTNVIFRVGFNADPQLYYKVLTNGISDKDSLYEGAVTAVVVLEITKLYGSLSEIVLGEMFFEMTGENQVGNSIKGGNPVVTMVNPIPTH